MTTGFCVQMWLPFVPGCSLTTYSSPTTETGGMATVVSSYGRFLMQNSGRKQLQYILHWEFSITIGPDPLLCPPPPPPPPIVVEFQPQGSRLGLDWPYLSDKTRAGRKKKSLTFLLTATLSLKTHCIWVNMSFLTMIPQLLTGTSLTTVTLSYLLIFLGSTMIPSSSPAPLSPLSLCRTS